MREETKKPEETAARTGRHGWMETGWTALQLGLTSFGGPVAHIGYFRDMYVRRKRWLDEQTFADLTAMCQFLPGPASSQLGMAIAMRRAGVAGALAAWVGFTLPSAVLLVLFAYGYHAINVSASGIIHGFMLAAVAVVAHAVWSMGRTLVPDLLRAFMAILTASVALTLPGTAGQLFPLIVCGLIGWFLLRRKTDSASRPDIMSNDGRKPGFTYLVLFAVLLALFPLLSHYVSEPYLKLADIGYRAGSLVFGGGHVVLPMLEHESVKEGFLSGTEFVAGYGAAQAVPGPLFTFAAYVGAASSSGTDGLLRAAVMLTAVFLPSFLLVAGVMPFWDRLRVSAAVRAAMAGVNASVVGLLLAALYDPVWISAVHNFTDFAVAAVAFACLMYRKIPPLPIVAACAAAGWIIV
jgi:chromate transporter